LHRTKETLTGRASGRFTLMIWTLVALSMTLRAQSVTFSAFTIPTQNSLPAGITAGPDGALWFTETFANKIGRISTSGAITEFPLPASSSYPGGITSGADGALWFGAGSQIGRITTSGAVTWYPVPSGFVGAMVAGPDGAIWFGATDYAFSSSIGRITAAGILTQYPISPDKFPNELCVGPDGALWFTEISAAYESIGRISTGGAVTEYTIAPSGIGLGGMVAGPDGAVWFTEEYVGRVGKITTAGAVTEYPATGLIFPSGIVKGSDGALWVTDGQTLGQISSNGVITTYPLPDTQDSLPFLIASVTPPVIPIALGSDGALWLARNNHIVRASIVFPTSGNVTVTSVPPGLAVMVDGVNYFSPRSFNWAAGEHHTIGVGSPQIGGTGVRYSFVNWSDGGAQSHSITVPTSLTTVTATFVRQYLLTTGVAPAGGGAIAATPSALDGYYDSGISVTLAATANPGFQFSNWSSDLAGAQNPQPITMSAPHTVQANFAGNSNLVTFSEYPIPSGSVPAQISAGPDGALWFTEMPNGGGYALDSLAIARITTDGIFTEYPGSLSDNPVGITPGSDGALWFTEGGQAGSIGRITTAGVKTEYKVPEPVLTSFGLAGITAGPDGALWFTDATTISVDRITTAGVIGKYPIPSGRSPGAIALGPDGALWFTESGSSDDGIGRITTSGNITEYTLPAPNSFPYGIAAGPDGALWFTESTRNQIGRITTGGAISEYLLRTPASSPTGITAGPDGALWFAEGGSNNIGRITTSGGIAEYPIPTPSTSLVSALGGITAGPDGAIWFTEGTKIGRIVLPSSVACTYSLPQSSASVPAGATVGAAIVRAPAGGAAGCAWTAGSNVSWLTITSGSSGRGNGTVSYAVAANSSTVTRTGTITIAGQPFTVTQAGSALSPACSASAPTASPVAVEGRTELLSDYVLTCSGFASALTVDLSFLINTNITNHLTGSATDVALTINGAQTAQKATLSGFNTISWTGVTLAPAANGSVVLRISKVRADASQLLTQRTTADPGSGQPNVIRGQVSIRSQTPVPVSNVLQVVATAVQSLVFTSPGSAASSGGAQTTLPVVFQEAQSASFQSSVTRLRISLAGVSPSVQIYAPIFAKEGSARAQLYTQDPSGLGGSPQSGTTIGTGAYQQLNAVNGTITATWLVLNADPSVIETYTFPLLVANAVGAELSKLQVSGTLAPVSDIGIASTTAPLPRYRDLSAQPKLANLRVSTSVQLQAGSPGQPTGPKTSNASVLYLLFTHHLVDDTSDPSQGATNVVLQDNLPTGLTLISCAFAGGNCGISGNQIQVNVGNLGAGQGATVSIVAQIDPSFTGVLDNAVAVTSDEVNLDLLAGTSSSSFIVLPGTPVAVGGAPASGSGNTQTFAFQFSHSFGYQNLAVLNILINSALDGRNACYLAYEVKNSKLDLVDDAGDAGGPYDSVLLGSSTPIQNAQCAVTLVSAQGSGNDLVLTMNITFKPGFGGNKVVYVAARDASQGNTDWQGLGVWQVPSSAGTIAVAGLSPARGAGNGKQFVLTVTDTKGTGDFGVVNLLINRSIDGRKACYLAYSAASGILYLVDDTGDAGGPFAGQISLNGTNVGLQNGQCSVNGSSSSVNYSANTMTLTLNIAFTGAFAGNQVVYAAARDRIDQNNTGWRAVGTWTVQ